MSEQAPQTLTDFERYNNSELLLFVHGSNEAAEEIAYALDDGEERDRAELEKVFRGLAAIAILQDRWLPNPENDPTLSSSRKGLAGELRGAETLEELKDAAEFYTSEEFDDEILERPVPVFEKDNIRTRFSDRTGTPRKPSATDDETPKPSSKSKTTLSPHTPKRGRGKLGGQNLITPETENDREFVPINIPTATDSVTRIRSSTTRAQRRKLLANENELLASAKAGDKEAMQKLMELHSGAIKSVLFRKIPLARDRSREMSMDDLVQSAYLGFMQAVEKFKPDHSKGSFYGFARMVIKNKVNLEASRMNSTFYIPANVQTEIRTITQIEHDLATKLEREPTHDEIADYAGVLAPEVKKLLLYRARFNSESLDEDFDPEADPHFFDFENFDEAVFDDPTPQDEGIMLDKAGPSDLDDPEEYATDAAVALDMVKMLDESDLDLREKRVIIERFGLHDQQPKTLDEVGVLFGLTRERIRQIESKGMAKLRSPKSSNKFIIF